MLYLLNICNLVQEAQATIDCLKLNPGRSVITRSKKTFILPCDVHGGVHVGTRTGIVILSVLLQQEIPLNSAQTKGKVKLAPSIHAC